MVLLILAYDDLSYLTPLMGVLLHNEYNNLTRYTDAFYIFGGGGLNLIIILGLKQKVCQMWTIGQTYQTFAAPTFFYDFN